MTLRGMAKEYPSRDGLKGTKAVDGIDLELYADIIYSLIVLHVY